MKIGLYTDEEKLIIAAKKYRRVSIHTLLPHVLFQDPDLLHSRFIELIKTLFNYNPEEPLERLTFSFNATTFLNKIIAEGVLEKLTLKKNYNGFNIRNYFSDICKRKNIKLITPGICLGRGEYKKIKKEPLPAMVISLTNTPYIGILESRDAIYEGVYNHIQLKRTGHSFENDLLTESGQIEATYLGEMNIINRYTQNIITIIKALKQEVEAKIEAKIKTIIIHQPRFQLINTAAVEASFNNINLIIRSPSDFESTIVNGLFFEHKIIDPGISEDEDEREMKKYAEEISKKGFISSYWADGEVIKKFKTEEEMILHFMSTKDIAAEDNKYTMLYPEGIEIASVKQLKNRKNFMSIIEPIKK